MSPKDVIHIKRKAMTQPQLNRRGFIGAFLGAAVIDPERLLFVPGRKMISIPAPRMFTPKEIEDHFAILNKMLDRWSAEFYHKTYIQHCIDSYQVMGTGLASLSYEPRGTTFDDLIKRAYVQVGA